MKNGASLVTCFLIFLPTFILDREIRNTQKAAPVCPQSVETLIPTPTKKHTDKPEIGDYKVETVFFVDQWNGKEWVRQ